METTESNVFEEVEQYYQPASTGRRFVNYLVDTILYYVFLFGCFFLIGIITQLSGGASEDIDAAAESWAWKLLTYLFVFAIMLLFYTLVEGLTKGRSMGKLITGTVAIREDGSQISWKDALMRSLCRLIPFEAFSAFSGRPWHDTMTKTVVIRK